MPIEQLRQIDVPEWLSALSEESIEHDPFPLECLLHDSLYYPGSGFDGNPVKYLGGNILSFIYADYGETRKKYMDVMRNPGFKGYQSIGTRSVEDGELGPGLDPRDWDPEWSISGYEPHFHRKIQPPFYEWSVWEREESCPIIHGPERFSFLYLCAEGVTAFRNLYVRNSIAPKAIAIIQAGTGAGGNWTNFENPSGILARSVFMNQAGPPELLLYGGMGHRELYCEACWPYYQNFICFLPRSDGSIGVLSRNWRTTK